MTDKELRRLKRTELLEMLLKVSKENEALRQQLDEANKKLEDRQILLTNAGSIAEAALQINDVFDAAQKAADQYLASVMRLADRKAERDGDDSQ
jgi:glutathione S-transferase